MIMEIQSLCTSLLLYMLFSSTVGKLTKASGLAASGDSQE